MLMYRTMCGWIAATTLFGAVGLSLVLGPERVLQETRAAVQRIEQAFNKSVSNAQLLAAAQVALNDYKQHCDKLEDNLLEIDDRIAESQDTLRDGERERKHHEDALRLAKLKLTSPSESFEINGRTYSRADIERDAEKRLQLCRDATTRLAAVRETLTRLEQIRSDVAGNLRQLQAVREEKAGELELLAARIKNAEVLAQLADLKRKFEHPAGDTTKFAQTVAEIERRIRDAERRATFAANQTGDLIDWTAKKRDLIADIDAQLAVASAPASVAKK